MGNWLLNFVTNYLFENKQNRLSHGVRRFLWRFLQKKFKNDNQAKIQFFVFLIAIFFQNSSYQVG
ncbi:hypothetical protein VB638_12500 [Dolichospermum sp. UHCC 0684]|uniref:hypothetical protein n=1 Tax=Dolichospermum sp. UHCC 0260 TaxID=2590025 RepID=UPI0008001D70|nr:hypothetical protein [Dolichospermum sp. UHCC 0260]MEA5530395.1 hypothetical protein [Dolichospermum sp. UHCC 0684]MTJ37231.1 hypothetical protein [Dolichospermum sp. UHCC 0260]OBQ34061.1 MAG: hypothetical protein AN485_17025 [Anabaena sp. MDT14b]